MNNHIYHYACRILDVYDGDTMTVEIDLGFNLKLTDKVRLYEVNAPEIRGKSKKKGIEVKMETVYRLLGRNEDVKKYAPIPQEIIRDFLKTPRPFMIQTVQNSKKIKTWYKKEKRGKYGRWLGVIWYKNENDQWQSLNEDLKEMGYEAHYG